MKLSVIKRNVFSNMVGSGLAAGLTIIITPLQINMLGIEAYGVVGFIATLQVMFAAFDLGLSSTLTRELAADTSLDKRDSQGLLSTASAVYWFTAILIGLLIGILAKSISHWWFHAEELGPDELSFSIRVIALYLALRWPAALYVGVLSGLQRMDVMNLVKIVVTVVRLGGGIVVLLIERSLNAFLLWTAFSAIFEVAAYLLACRRVMPTLSMLPGFSFKALKTVWKFSVSMNVLAILAILITQVDRLAISKMETLQVLGYYNLAYTAASGIPMIIAAMGSAVFPWFAQAQRGPNLDLLRERYNSASWGLIFLVGLSASALIFFGHFLLGIWVNQKAAEGAAIPLALLAGGFWFSALVTNAYNVAIARGMPARPLYIALMSFLPYGALVIFLVREMSAIGAASAWLCLNIVNFILLVPHIHRNILYLDTWTWMKKVLFPLMVLSGVSFIPLKILVAMQGLQGSVLPNLVALSVATAFYLSVGYRISPLTNLKKV